MLHVHPRPRCSEDCLVLCMRGPVRVAFPAELVIILGQNYWYHQFTKEKAAMQTQIGTRDITLAQARQQASGSSDNSSFPLFSPFQPEADDNKVYHIRPYLVAGAACHNGIDSDCHICH